MAKEMVCSRCGTKAKPKTRVKGGMGTEIVLWLLFIVPGVIYSIWRLTTKTKVCPACESEELVPPDSPVGQKLAS